MVRKKNKRQEFRLEKTLDFGDDVWSDDFQNIQKNEPEKKVKLDVKSIDSEPEVNIADDFLNYFSINLFIV